MKRLYQIVIERGSTSPGQTHDGSTRATSEAIAAAERRLGAPLPKTFKRFAKEVGRATWPVEIFSVAAIDAAAAHPPPGRPAYVVPFATDGGGNDWFFDTRRREGDECPIGLWNHAEPPGEAELAEPGTAWAFDAWLEEKVNRHLADDERTAFADRLRRIEQALAPHRAPGVRPRVPSREDVAAVEATLRMSLPKDYVGFTTHVGSTSWPLEIVDAQELTRLNDALHTRFGRKAHGVVAFGHEVDGAFVGFDKRGKLVAFGGYPIEDATFFDFLERRIRERSLVEGAAASGDARAPSSGEAAAPPEIPYGIVDDDWINSVWRAVAKASRHTVVKTADGRMEVAVEDYEGGKRRMFVDAATWSTIEEHLARLRK